MALVETDIQTDFYSARITAATLQTVSKRRIRPLDLMQKNHSREVRRQMAELEALEAERVLNAPPLSFEEIKRGLMRSGVRVIDGRQEST